jgi:hypothetical protein
MEDSDSPKELKWYQQEWLKWAAPAGAAILGSVLTILVQQIFLSRSAAIEQKSALRKEVIKEQYSHILKIKRFANIGSNSNTVVFLQTYVSPNGDIIGESEQGPDYFLPAVAHDQGLRNEWRKLAAEIENRKSLIEPDVYEEFDQIMNFVEKNPLPDTSTVSKIEKSPYSEPDKVATFTSLHEYLLTKVDAMTGFEE